MLLTSCWSVFRRAGKHPELVDKHGRKKVMQMADYRQCLKLYAMCLENWFSHAGLMNGSHFKEYGECGSCTVLASDCCYAGNSYCEH